jgi:hypothetical protein
MYLRKWKRKFYIFRARYATLFMIISCAVSCIFRNNITSVIFWICWFLAPCGLVKIHDFFKTKWFVIPRQSFAIAMIIYYSINCFVKTI